MYQHYEGGDIPRPPVPQHSSTPVAAGSSQSQPGLGQGQHGSIYGPMPLQPPPPQQTTPTQPKPQPFKIPYSEPQSEDPFLSSLDPAKYEESGRSVSSLRDRFRVTSAIAFSVMFHWAVIYTISFVLHLWKYWSFKFMLDMSTTLIWQTFIISVCVGLISFLHFLQIEWSQPRSLDQINTKVTTYCRISTVGYFFGYLFVGTILTTAYLGLYNGGFTTTLECSGTEGCLNDKYLFILFASLYSLGKAFVNLRRSEQFRIEFPDVAQSIHGKIRYFCLIYFTESSQDVLANLPLIYLVYYFMGATFRIWVSQSTNLNLGVNLLQTLSHFISIKLFSCVLVTSSFAVGTFKVSWEFLYLCLTKRRVFPLDVDPLLETGGDAGSILLTDALRAPESDYMRNLAFYDVYCMTDKAEKRVEDLFRVGYKGDKTLLWTTVLEECLKPLKNTSDAIKSFIRAELESQKQTNTAYRNMGHPDNPAGASATVTLLGESDHEHGSSGTSNLNIRRRGAYPMRPLDTTEAQAQGVEKPLTPVQVLLIGTFRMDKVEAALSNFFRNLKWTGFHFNRKLEAQISMLLADSQVMIMSLRTLMNAVNLYVKESYADVVQRDLPSIIITLIEAKESVELLAKLEKRRRPSTPAIIIGDLKSQTVVGSNFNLLQTQSYLNASLTNALLELDYHFRPYLEFMPISFDLRNKLRIVVSNNNFLAEGHFRNSK